MHLSPVVEKVETRKTTKLRSLADYYFYYNIFTVTVPLLETGHLEEDYPITTFFENKRFLRFFTNRPLAFMNLSALS